MTDRHPDDSHLDAAIDRAVREMMSVEPRGDLRGRVLAELAGLPARAAIWPRLALGSAALAVAVVIALVFVERPVDRPVDQTIAATLPQATTPAGQSGSSGAMTGSTPKAPDGNRRPANTPHAERVARRPYVDDRPVQAASIDTVEAISVEPMTPVERLMPIDSIGLLPVARSEISLKPITIERIEITPLTPQR